MPSLQLFNTYSGSRDASSVDYITQRTDPSSIVFNSLRGSIITQGEEFGIPHLASQDYDPVLENDATVLTGVTFKGYKGTDYTLYVNKYGDIALDGYVPIAIEEFKICNGSNNDTTNTRYPAGTAISSEIHHFAIILSGTCIDRPGNISRCILTALGTMPTTQGSYPSSSGTIVANPEENCSHVNTGVQHTGAHGDELEMRLYVEDIKGNHASATITVAKFIAQIYYGLSSSVPNSLNSFTAQYVGNIGGGQQQTATMPNGSTSDYFWVLVPEEINPTVVMYQGGGVAQWYPAYNGTLITINSKQYRAYRTTNCNLGGASYGVKITL